MSYTPTEWTIGDIITAEKLNKIESGVAEANGGTELPEYTAADIGKSLSVVSTGSSTETVTVIQEQTLTLTVGQSITDPVAYLAAGTYDFSSLSIGDTVTAVISIDGEPGPGTGEVTSGSILGLSDVLVIIFTVFAVASDGTVYSGISGDLTISAIASITIHEPGIAWAKPSPAYIVGFSVNVEEDAIVTTLDKTWQQIYNAALFMPVLIVGTASGSGQVVSYPVIMVDSTSLTMRALTLDDNFELDTTIYAAEGGPNSYPVCSIVVSNGNGPYYGM